MIRLSIFLLLLGGVSSLLADPPAIVPPVVDLEEPAVPLEPQRPLSQRDHDRTEAVAMYAYGQLLKHRHKYDEALQQHQRAWRMHPQADFLLPEIVFLCHSLGRRVEASRYAVLAAERVEIDQDLLRSLAMLVGAREQWDRAAKLYEKLLQTPPGEKPEDPQADVGRVLLQLERGRMLFLSEDFTGAAKAFDHVREALEDPKKLAQNDALRKMVLANPRSVYELIAESYLQSDRYRLAEKMYHKSYGAKPDESGLAFCLSRTQSGLKNYDQALSYLRQHLTTPSKIETGLQPYEMLEHLLEKKHDDPDQVDRLLLRELEELRKKRPDHTPLNFFLADLHRRRKRHVEAEKILRRMLKNSPGFEVYETALEVYQSLDQPPGLLQVLAAVAVETGSLESLGEAAEKLAQNDALRRRVAQLAAEAPEAAPDAPPAQRWGGLLAAAHLERLAENNDQADALFARAWKAAKPKESEFAMQWGLEMLFSDRYDACEKIFRQLIAGKPLPERLGACQFYLGRALELQNQTTEALQSARKAAELAPKIPRFQIEPGWVLYHAHRYEEAKEVYQKWLEKYDEKNEPEELREELRSVRLTLSALCVELGQRAEGEEWLEQVLDEYPEDIGAMNDLGYLWAEQGKRLERALVMIQKAVAAEPDNAAYLDSLGWVYYKLDRPAEAVQALEKAVALDDEPDGVILDHLGDALHKNGQTQKAVELWRRAADSFRENDHPEKLQTTESKIKNHEK